MRGESIVCIIDDEEAIRESLRLLLFSEGLSSHAYESADEFIRCSDQLLEARNRAGTRTRGIGAAMH